MEEKVLVTYDDHRNGYVLKEDLDKCPKCKKKSVRAKELFEGGGVVCITPDCRYWYCV